VYEREEVYRILDEGMVCHVAFVANGQPFCIPTGYGRRGEYLYLHGKSSSHMIKHLASGAPVCITVTLVDALVLARSVFHHSMNYRSVVIFGNAEEISDPKEKVEAMAIFTEHIIPGRWNDSRLPNDNEIKATKMVRIHLEKVSAKVRTGPPGDDEEDLSLPHWCGLLPLKSGVDQPIDDPTLAQGIVPPTYVADYDRKRMASERSAQRQTQGS